MTEHDERLLDGEEDDEYLEDYHYQDWGVDRVDLDFKSVSDLQSLLSDRRRGQLSYNLYKLYDKIDASLRQDLRSVTLKPGPDVSLGSSLVTHSSQHITTRSITNGGDTAQTASTSLKNLLSSTGSLQTQERERLSIEDSPTGDDFGLLSSYLSSTEPSLLPSMPTEQSDSSSFGSALINFAFIIIFILVSVFIVIQCSHFVVYIARQAFKNRNSGRKLPEFLRSRLTTETEVAQDYTMNERVRGLVVEVDCNNQVSAHTAAGPGSPVSILHNSPFYSPVKQTVTPGPLSPAASSHRSTPFMEAIIGNSNVCSDDQDEVESTNQDDPQEVTNDSDEGIESEEGDEDIDGEAFKQLIREKVPEPTVFSKTPLLYSNCFSKEEIYGKFSPPGLIDNCHFPPGERGNSVDSPSCDISGLSSFSSVSPPSPLLVTRWSRDHGHLIPHIPATGGVGECLI